MVIKKGQEVRNIFWKTRNTTLLLQEVKLGKTWWWWLQELRQKFKESASRQDVTRFMADFSNQRNYLNKREDTILDILKKFIYGTYCHVNIIFFTLLHCQLWAWCIHVYFTLQYSPFTEAVFSACVIAWLEYADWRATVHCCFMRR